MKCYWCKSEVPKDEVYVDEYLNKNGIFSKRKGHKKCYELSLKRKKLEDAIAVLEGVPSVSFMRSKIKELLFSGYTFDVILMAVDLSQRAINKNFDKGWHYHFAIIQNNLPLAFKRLQEKKQSLMEQNKPILDLDMSKVKRSENKDYSNLL